MSFSWQDRKGPVVGSGSQPWREFSLIDWYQSHKKRITWITQFGKALYHCIHFWRQSLLLFTVNWLDLAKYGNCKLQKIQVLMNKTVQSCLLCVCSVHTCNVSYTVWYNVCGGPTATSPYVENSTGILSSQLRYSLSFFHSGRHSTAQLRTARESWHSAGRVPGSKLPFGRLETELNCPPTHWTRKGMTANFSLILHCLLNTNWSIM